MAESAAQPAAAYEYPPLRGGKLLFLTAAIMQPLTGWIGRRNFRALINRRHTV
jgi:hypothetical protein